MGLASPFAAGSAEGPLAARDAALSAVDAPRLARFLATMLPRGDATALLLRAGSGVMAARLAAELPRGASLYAAEAGEAAAQALAARSGAARNLYPLALPDGEAAGLLAALPTPAHVVLALACADWLAARMGAVAARLAPGGRLLVMEEEPEALDRVVAAAAAAGLAPSATPDVSNEHFAVVLSMRHSAL